MQWSFLFHQLKIDSFSLLQKIKTFAHKTSVSNHCKQETNVHSLNKKLKNLIKYRNNFVKSILVIKFNRNVPDSLIYFKPFYIKQYKLENQ